MVIASLPKDVIDRIAAGEVVERPASVVKELLENALDAGATDVAVSVDGGGLQLIRVADNGGGIAPAELRLAVASHATSKLHDVDDLFHIASFGFRGEALSSVAAVSRLRLVSRTADEPAAWRLDVEAGVAGEPAAASLARGTVVEVRDLFFNTPARRRFLGAAMTEAARCREVCAALSLVHPGLRVRFESDGRPRFAAPGTGTLADRVAAVWGEEFRRELVPVTGRVEGLSVEGLLSLPGFARPRPRAQQLFVNGRLVRDRAVMAAVRAGCKDFLPGSLQPSWILSLTVDPQRVDVNVHPTKAEVRFRDGDALFSLVRGACRAALLACDLTPRVTLGAGPGGAGHAGGFTAAARETAVPASAFTLPPRKQRPPGESGSWPAGAVAEAAALPDLSAPRRVAPCVQVLDTYIVHAGEDGLVLVDQHALHERILYARLQAALAEGRLESQRLLLPEAVRLSPALHARALELAPALERLGLSLAEFGPDTLAIHSIPAVLRQESLADLLVALVEPPDVHGGIPHGLDRRLFTMACHAAVKAGDPLTAPEMEALLRQGEELEHDATCPHGRPTRLAIGRTELERLFKRSGF
ncbi:MAG TPA: DNA mismatch repair endonuclease MutL [Planctomycetota bacterium]|nr:DNA mismatch repair endonuclease MutL [Planctomycetota bacterium]